MACWSIPPDGIWWNRVGNRYARVSGDSDVGLRCGSSSLYLFNVAGSGDWAFGASNKYTPDGLWWETTHITDRLHPCLGGDVSYHRGTMDGPHTRWFSWGWKSVWNFGASSPRFNQYNILEVLS